MKGYKKILSLMLCAAMVYQPIPKNVLAVETEDTSVMTEPVDIEPVETEPETTDTKFEKEGIMTEAAETEQETVNSESESTDSIAEVESETSHTEEQTATAETEITDNETTDTEMDQTGIDSEDADICMLNEERGTNQVIYEAGRTWTLDGFSGSNTTYINNGTISVNGTSYDFLLMSGAAFENNNSFSFAGSYYSSFNVMSGCSFTNNGIATIDNCYNFSIEGSFDNTGTLFLKNISSYNLYGTIHNTGTIVYDDTVNVYMVQALKEQTSGNGKVMTVAEYNSPQKETYTISYNLNGGSWITASTEAIQSYCYDPADPNKEYRIETHAPFDKLHLWVAKENYHLTGWTCDQAANTTPDRNLWIKTNWRSNITLTADWSPVNYTIYYDLDGGTFEENLTFPEIIKDENEVYSVFTVESETFSLPTPVKAGYEFAGWKRNDEVNQTVTIEKGSSDDRLYTAMWTPKGNIPYRVQVYYMDAFGQYPEAADLTRQEQGKTDDRITIPASTYAKKGFVFDTEKSVTSGVITQDGTLALSLYYAREQYDITFKSYDGTETLYTYKGYYGSEIIFSGTVPTMTEEGYSVTFAGWANEAYSQESLSELGIVSEAKTLYAAFAKDANFCVITFSDITGFAPLQNTVFKVDKGANFSISLYLADDHYYVGTNEWAIAFAESHITDSNGKGLTAGTDFTYTFGGYGTPLVLSIPNVTKDLNVKLSACYHEQHDYLMEKDIVQKAACCSGEGEVLRYCYKCGKTVTEKLGIDSANHVGLVKVEKKDATNNAEGNIEYWYCKDCGKYFADKDGKKEISNTDIVIVKLTDKNEKNDQGIQKETESAKDSFVGTAPDTSANTSPNTGDHNRIGFWLLLLLTSGGMLLCIYSNHRKKKVYR